MKDKLLAAIVLLGFVAVLILVPHEVIKPVAVVAFTVSVGGLAGAKALLQRLNGVEKFVRGSSHSYHPYIFSSCMTAPERTLLALGAPPDVERALATLRRRQALITSAGTLLGVVAVGAALLIVFKYAD